MLALNAQALRDEIRANPNMVYVVKMYAEWCSHCKKVHHQFTQASVLVHNSGKGKGVLGGTFGGGEAYGNKVKFAKVNIYDASGANDMIPNYYGIKTTPAFVMFKNGDPGEVTLCVSVLVTDFLAP